MSTFGTRLKSLRKDRKITQGQLGKVVGVSDVTVGYWEKDQNKPGGESLTKLAKYFGVSETFLITGNEGKPNVSPAALGAMRIPIISWVQAGNWASEVDARNLEGTFDYILTTEIHSISTFALNVKGKSMEPEFKEGDTIVIDPDICPNPGDYVVAKNGSGEATFKKYRSRGISDDGTDIFELVPLNPDYATLNSTQTHIIIIGVVVEHRRKMR
ncbi:helix-turn-helix domain-containing protein [Pectobacterium brasiliense]|uniref:LexA family protein n=1 Tax=Pectobacterium brasiliense TaxID=180957 RepID=UPI001969D22F|nr:S24 family peptidase [Pectobacterium brasiliense]MBN3344876.1 helix-turn-helix domain-containing protein [Pectobacterium brasiliense]